MSVAGARAADALGAFSGSIRPGSMKHYRIEKVTKPGGVVLKRKDILAASDQDAMARAEQSADCPVCDVLHNGKPIGSIA